MSILFLFHSAHVIAQWEALCSARSDANSVISIIWMNDVLILTHFNYLVNIFLNTLLSFIVHLFKRQSHYGVYVPRDNYNKYCYHNNNSPYYHFLNTPNFANPYTVKDVQKITSNAMLSIYKTIIFFSTFYILFQHF